MKKTNINKVVVVVITVFVCFFMTACKKNEASATAEATSGSVIETDEAEVDESAEESVTTDETTAPAAEGMYTYTIYEGTENEMTLSMGVNIDDYVISNSYTDRFFSIYNMATDLGWLPNGDPNFEVTDSGLVYYSYDNGDGTQTVFTGAYNYTDENTPMGFPQINSYNVHFTPLNDTSVSAYPEDGLTDNHRSINVITNQHYDDLSYVTLNAGAVAASRDDIVVIAYIFWSASVHPGENCFYYCDLANLETSRTSGNATYTLP